MMMYHFRGTCPLDSTLDSTAMKQLDLTPCDMDCILRHTFGNTVESR